MAGLLNQPALPTQGARTPWQRYGVALASVLLAFLARWGLDPWLKNDVPFLFFSGAVAVAAYFGRLIPGLLAIILSAGLAQYAFISRGLHWELSLAETVDLASFCAVGVIITLTLHYMHRVRRESDMHFQAICRQEQLLRDVFENTHQGYCVTDAEGQRLVYLNHQFATLFQVPAAQLQASPLAWLERVLPKYRPQVDQCLARLTEKSECEYEIARPDQSPAWIRQQTFPVRENSGAVMRRVIEVQDITARHQAAETIRAQNEQLQVITDSVPALISYVDADTRYRFNNRAYEMWFGQPREAILGKTMSEVLGDKAFQAIRPQVEAALAGQSVQYEKWVPYREGGTRCILASYVPHQFEGRKSGFFVLVQDISERKRTLEALNESERRFRLATAAGKVATWDWDLETNTLTGSDQLYTFCGVAPDEYRNANHFFDKLIHPDDREQVRETIRSALSQRSGYRLEARIIQPGGNLRWLLSTGRVIEDPAGKPARVIGTVLDITERKQMELALRESEENFREIFEAANEGIWMLDLDGQILLANQRLGEMLGFSSHQILRRFPWDFGFPEDAASLRKLFARRQQGISENVDVRFRHRNGQTVWCLVSSRGLLGRHGNFRGALEMLTDITDRKQAEAELQQQHRRVQLLAETAGHLLWAANGDRLASEVFDCIATELSLAACAYFTAVPEGQHFVLRLVSSAGLVDPAALSKPLPVEDTPWGRAAVALKPLLFSNVQQQTDPSFAIAQACGMRVLACCPLLTGDRLVGVLCFGATSRDQFTKDEFHFLRTICHYFEGAQERLRLVNELMERARHLEASQQALLHAKEQLQNQAELLEQRVAERTVKLQEKVAELEAFSYSISHDLRSPLRALQGYSHLLLQDYGPQLDATARDYLERMSRASNRLDHLIQDVLTYSRVARGEVYLRKVDLEPLLLEILDQYPGLKPPAAQITIERPLLPVLGQESYLTQCIANLLNNAVKFVDPGTTPAVRIWTERFGKNIRLFFADNGIGIASEFQTRIFSLFERLNAQFEGTGVGLAIVRKAIERMDGEVGVHSEPGRGSTFWLQLKEGP